MNAGLSNLLLLGNGENEVNIGYLDENGSYIGISHCILVSKQLLNISTLNLHISGQGKVLMVLSWYQTVLGGISRHFRTTLRAL